MAMIEALPVHVARLTREALEEEPAVWPRLGLVGPEDCGSHRDMDIAHFSASAAALEPYFADIVRLGLGRGRVDGPARSQARALGLVAERTMLAATGGRNTHKGAVFLLGVFLLSWAAGQCSIGTVSVTTSLRRAARAYGPALLDELPRLRAEDSYGAWAFRRHRAAGMRGLVLADFAPLLAVWHHSCALERRRVGALAARLGSARLLAAALSDDTNLLKRAGWRAREALRGEIHGLWRRGGPLDPRNARELAALELRVETMGWSAAASGDLLAAILLFRKLCAEGLARP